MSAERVLERAVQVAGAGLKNPLLVLAEVAKRMDASGDTGGVDHAGALIAVEKVAGCSLVDWYGATGGERTVGETVELFADALFELQIGGVASASTVRPS